MRIDILQGKDIHKTRPLYEKVFQDSREYTDFFYEKAEEECVAVAAMAEEKVIGEIFLVPKTIRICENLKNVYYIYGVATDEAYRGRGIMKALMEFGESYARNQGIDILYLIPVNPALYESLGYRLVKSGSRKNYKIGGKDKKIMLQSESVSLETLCESISALETQIYNARAVIPKRDRAYFREKIQRARMEQGELRAFFEIQTKKMVGICAVEEREDTLTVVDMVCRPEMREALIQCYMKEQKLPDIVECIFPIMVKCLDEGWSQIEDTEVFLNDEI